MYPLHLQFTSTFHLQNFKLKFTKVLMILKKQKKFKNTQKSPFFFFFLFFLDLQILKHLAICKHQDAAILII